MPEQSEDGLYVSAGDEIDQAGLWWMLLDVVAPDGETSRAAFAWQISEAAAVQQSRQPQLIHFIVLLSIAGRVGRLGVWAGAPPPGSASTDAGQPAYRGRGGGRLAGRHGRRRADAGRAAARIRPDAESAAGRGQQRVARCRIRWRAARRSTANTAWSGKGESADFRALRNRLASARDDFLYEAVVSGWRGLPACGAALSERGALGCGQLFPDL